MGAAQRLHKSILPRRKTKGGNSLTRLPWTVEEAKAHLGRRYEYDEKNFTNRMQGEGSIASRILGHFQLTRTIVKSAFNSMRFKRAAQVVLGGLVCATRFKYHDEGGNLLPALCPFCRR